MLQPQHQRPAALHGFACEISPLVALAQSLPEFVCLLLCSAWAPLRSRLARSPALRLPGTALCGWCTAASAPGTLMAQLPTRGRL